MSMLSMIFPMQAALPAAQAVAGSAVGIARPLLGVSAFAAVLLAFKPLLSGVLRAALLAISPRQTVEERNRRTKMQGVLMLNQMARDLDATQPSLAAELRSFAGRA